MLEFVPVSKDRLFYDQYEYSICVAMPEAGVLRAKSAQALLESIAWRNTQRAGWGAGNTISGQARENLISMFDELELVRDQIKLIVSYGIVYVYSNNISVLKRLADLSYVRFLHATQAVVDRPRDVVLINNPKFQYRSYFKERYIEPEDRDRLLNFVDLRGDTFKITNTLRAHLKRNQWHWVQRHHFIEHNDAKDITMLSLVVPGLIRKTVPVQAK